MSKATLNHLMTLWTIIWYPIFIGAAPAAMIYAGNWYYKAGGHPEAIWGYPALIGGLLAVLVALYFLAYNSVSSHPQDDMPSLFGFIAMAIAAWPLSLCVLIGYGLYTYGYEPLLEKMRAKRDYEPPAPVASPAAVAASHSHAHTAAQVNAVASEQLSAWLILQQLQHQHNQQLMDAMLAEIGSADDSDDEEEVEFLDFNDDSENLDAIFYPYEEIPLVPPLPHPPFEVVTIHPEAIARQKLRAELIRAVAEGKNPVFPSAPEAVKPDLSLKDGLKEWDE